MEISEKDMEDQIVAEPGKFLKESGLKLIARQYSIGNYRFDILFQDRHGGKLVVELQKGTLDREHMYKILDYCEAFKIKNPEDFVEPIIVANIIPYERKRHLSARGISFFEIPEDYFSHEARQPSKFKNLATSNVVQNTVIMQCNFDDGGFVWPEFTKEQNSKFCVAFQNFKQVILPRKIEREQYARELLTKQLGNLSSEGIDHIFDLVNDDPTGPWFGQMLSRPNRNHIYPDPRLSASASRSAKEHQYLEIDALNKLIQKMLEIGDFEPLFEYRRKGLKIMSYALASLFMYIYRPDKFNIWLSHLHSGLCALSYITTEYPIDSRIKLATDVSDTYRQFNNMALKIRDQFSLCPQAMDWALWAMCAIKTGEKDNHLERYLNGTVK